VPRARRSTQRSEAQRSGATLNRGLAPGAAWADAAARPRLCDAADRKSGPPHRVRGTEEAISRIRFDGIRTLRSGALPAVDVLGIFLGLG
jgi:hypothetical protein